MNKIITISRQFGSGGREIGKKLADSLQIAYYDKEIITKVTNNLELDEKYIEKFGESAVSRSFPIAIGRTFSIPHIASESDTVFLAESKVINEFASNGSCVIIGRCADYILREQKPLKVFIYSSDINTRIKRCYLKNPAEVNISQHEMKKRILNVDKNRAKYYDYYTDMEWFTMSNYDLCINTSVISIKNAVALICNAIAD